MAEPRLESLSESVGGVLAIKAVRAAGEVIVGSPADLVFSYITNPINQSNWAPSFVELLEGPDGPPGPGVRYRGQLLGFGAVDFVIDEFEPGRAFRLSTDPRIGQLTHRFQVASSPAGCLVSHEVCLWPRRPFHLLTPLLHRRLKRNVAELNRRMKIVLDRL